MKALRIWEKRHRTNLQISSRQEKIENLSLAYRYSFISQDKINHRYCTNRLLLSVKRSIEHSFIFKVHNMNLYCKLTLTG